MTVYGNHEAEDMLAGLISLEQMYIVGGLVKRIPINAVLGFTGVSANKLYVDINNSLVLACLARHFSTGH